MIIVTLTLSILATKIGLKNIEDICSFGIDKIQNTTETGQINTLSTTENKLKHNVV